MKEGCAKEVVRVGASDVDAKIEELRRISYLMAFQARMPSVPFATRDEAFRQAGCDPHSAPYLFSAN